VELLWILGFNLLSGAGSAILAAGALLMSEPARRRLTPFAVSFATGTLLGAALLGLLPHALRALPAPEATGILLGGVVTFFVLEKLAIWRHCHARGCEIHSSAGALILVGDSLHNFVDGIAVAVALMTSLPLGIGTCLAVALHEFPQEIGDFFILIESGFSRRKAFLYNVVSSLAAVAGGLAAYLWVSGIRAIAPRVMAFSAAGFLYIALADLIPGHRRETNLRSAFQQVALILAGIAAIHLLHGKGA
jgi:zinc and cadmium transporter